ncbi:Mu transposase C-terminal domain-containing protein [Rhizobacter sp. Root404]|uniref:Mu transposase C-terminal domain-containing protein n=1 Tax=Rhizobacter sp. Root404 TaxID=1736528 RepID=UPI00138F65D4|nr:Mu transposase C-terminal domain-containing protein [Rhizobacter sp. Root404]
MHEAASQRLLRVIYSDPSRVSLMPIGEPKAWNLFVSRRHYDELIESGKWTIYVAPASPESGFNAQTDVFTPDYGTETQQKHGDDTHARLKNVFSSTESLLTAKGRGLLWQETKLLHPTLSKATFYKSVRRWLEGGLAPIALRARQRGKRKGAKHEGFHLLNMAEAVEATRSRAQQLLARGRPAFERPTAKKNGESRLRAAPIHPTLFRVDGNTLRVFTSYFDRKKRERGTPLPVLYEDMRKEVFSTPQPFGPPTKWPEWCVPSLREFRHYWNILTDYKQKRVAKHGAKTFETSARSKLGQAISAAYAAGRVGELDATIFNVPLVGDGPDAPLIGPPVVFRVRCKDTGQLLGLSVSLENASFNGAAMAIVNCFEDKTVFCEQLGVSPMVLPWNVAGLPAQLDVDQGETYNHKPERFTRLTGVSFHTMPGGRGDLKPGVESDWHTLQVKLSFRTPGAAIKAYEAEHGMKWHMRAAMTLKEFTRTLVLEELKRMHTPRLGIKLPEAMVADGVSTAPHEMFEWSVRKGGGSLKQVDETAVRLSLLPIEKASVTENGLTVKGLHYTCKPLAVAEQFSKARLSGRRTVDVVTDPLLVDRVWLIEGDAYAPSSYVLSRLNMNFVNQRSYAGKTWREVLKLIDDGKVINATKQRDLQSGLDQLTAMQEKFAKQAEDRRKQARADFPTNENALVRGQDDARLKEKNLTSPHLAISSPLAPAPSTVEAVVTPITQANRTAPTKKKSHFERLAARVESEAQPISVPKQIND